jgi:PleD family two-component response regulator
MNRNAIHILLADSDKHCQLLFAQALREISTKTVLHTVNDGFQLMEYLQKPETRLPNIIFLDFSLPLKNGIRCLNEIRRNRNLQHITTAIYYPSDSDAFLVEAFVNGANVYFKRPYDLGVLRTILDHVCNLNWQYAISGLPKENFLLNLNNIATVLASA